MKKRRWPVLVVLAAAAVALGVNDCQSNCSNVLLPYVGEVCGGGGGSIPVLPTPVGNPTATPTASPILTGLSRYMNTTDTSVAYNAGCLRAYRNEYGTVILDYGRGELQGDTYGVLLLGQNAFASLSAVDTSLRAFILGFVGCADGLDHVTLAIGTNNGAGSHPAAEITEIGRQWTLMVAGVESYVYLQGFSGRVDVLAANDIEADFGTYASTQAWLAGFDMGAGSPPSLAYLNFGTAQGCSTTEVSDALCALGGWTQERVWEVSWGHHVALPFPEIYREDGTNAAQWQKVALRSALLHASKMIFSGTLSQDAACDYTQDCDIDQTHNSMVTAWQQLRFVLNSDPQTANSLQSSASDMGWLE